MDKGQAIMKKHSSAHGKDDPKKDAASESGMDLASLRARSAAQFGGLQEKVEEAMKPKPHPDDIVVQCRIDGGTQYMRKFSCQSLGGLVLSR